MLDYEALKSVRYVIDQQGRKSAVQVDLETWVALLSYLEDLEDRDTLKDKLNKILDGPDISGVVLWEKAKAEW